MAHMMYSHHHATMAPPQKPETFMLSSEAQQSLPQDAQVALQQVDNCRSLLSPLLPETPIADPSPLPQ
jgi:transcription factor STE12